MDEEVVVDIVKLIYRDAENALQLPILVTQKKA